MSATTNGDQMGKLFDFLANAPEDETLTAMDCNDCCEKIARLAEQVANGAHLRDVLPEMQQFMRYWHDCREEFEALVAVLQREKQLEGFEFPPPEASMDPARETRMDRTNT